MRGARSYICRTYSLFGCRGRGNGEEVCQVERSLEDKHIESEILKSLESLLVGALAISMS